MSKLHSRVPTTGLFFMADQKQADKVEKVWAAGEWAKRHETQHSAQYKCPACPFCFKPAEGK